jgi:hypothetical protein
MVGAKQADEPISAGDFSFDTSDLNARLNEPVSQPLVIVFRMCNKQSFVHGM